MPECRHSIVIRTERPCGKRALRETGQVDTGKRGRRLRESGQMPGDTKRESRQISQWQLRQKKRFSTEQPYVT
jgi:hypothetical protein